MPKKLFAIDPEKLATLLKFANFEQERLADLANSPNNPDDVETRADADALGDAIAHVEAADPVDLEARAVGYTSLVGNGYATPEDAARNRTLNAKADALRDLAASLA